MVDLGLASLISGGLGLASGFLGDGGVSRRTTRGRGRQGIEKLRRGVNPFFSLEELLRRQQIAAIRGGFERGRQEIGGFGATARDAIRDRSAATVADINQSAINRGLFSTTAPLGAERGVAADTQRALTSVDESIARSLANLATKEGAAVSGGLEGLANLAARRGSFEERLGNKEFDLLTGIQTLPPPSIDFGGIGFGLASLFGGGGGGGSSGGGAFGGLPIFNI